MDLSQGPHSGCKCRVILAQVRQPAPRPSVTPGPRFCVSSAPPGASDFVQSPEAKPKASVSPDVCAHACARVQGCSNSGELDIDSRGVPGPGPRDSSPDVVLQAAAAASALRTDPQAGQAQRPPRPVHGARARVGHSLHSRGVSAGRLRRPPLSPSILSVCCHREPGESCVAFRAWHWKSHSVTAARVCPSGSPWRAGSRRGWSGMGGPVGLGSCWLFLWHFADFAEVPLKAWFVFLSNASKQLGYPEGSV